MCVCVCAHACVCAMCVLCVCVCVFIVVYITNTTVTITYLQTWKGLWSGHTVAIKKLFMKQGGYSMLDNFHQEYMRLRYLLTVKCTNLKEFLN